MNFDRRLKGLDGASLLDSSDGSELTLGKLCTTALLGDFGGTGIEKTRRFTLAVKLAPGGVQELSVEDLACVKESVGRVIETPLHAGQALVMLEQAEPEPTPEVAA